MKQDPAERFLKAHGFDLEALDLTAILNDFLEEMEAGLRGSKSSLEMIPAMISPSREVPVSEPVIVMDAGGTHLRVAVVRFEEEGRAAVSKYARHPMPGVDAALDADAFFDRMAGYLQPLVGEAERIGLCFSYATEITDDCDGILLHWSKQIQAPEVVGQRIGRNLLERLEGGENLRLTLLNDTVATLLAGVPRGAPRRCADYVGFILGTGTNTAYVESNSAITKRSDLDPDARQCINIESGAFGRCPRSDFDEALDARTIDPGSYPFEKMISGAYLGGVGREILQAAAREGMFSPPAGRRMLGWNELSTKEMDDFIKNPFVQNRFADSEIGENDRRLAWNLCRAVTERSARLTAVNIAAAVEKSGAGSDPLHPVCVNIDGSTYYRTFGLPSRVEEHLRRLLRETGNHAWPVRVEDSPVIGAAVAGLCRGG